MPPKQYRSPLSIFEIDIIMYMGLILQHMESKRNRFFKPEVERIIMRQKSTTVHVKRDGHSTLGGI